MKSGQKPEFIEFTDGEDIVSLNLDRISSVRYSEIDPEIEGPVLLQLTIRCDGETFVVKDDEQARTINQIIYERAVRDPRSMAARSF